VVIVHNEKILDVIRNTYTKDSLQNVVSLLQEKGTLVFHALKTNLFPAAMLSRETQYTGYNYVWIRDNIHVAHAHFVLGQLDVAKNVANSIMQYFRKNQRRFEDIIRDPVRANNSLARPHIRFDGSTLMEVDERWSHAQNDALGYFLWFYCQLIKNSKISPSEEDCQLLALFPLYFKAIEYWNDADSGHWEEEKKIEASSIGAVKAGLDALLEITMSFPQVEKLLVYNNSIVSPDLIAALAEHGRSALSVILPWECIKPSVRQRRYDAALLFLVYPLGVVNEEISDQIICDVTQHLQGDHGVRRYIGDSFWAPDYKSKLPPEKRNVDVSDDMSSRNTLVGEGQEAQWCIFDSILSVIFGLKFGRTGNDDHLQKQTWYLNRALGQLTGSDCGAGEFRCPELYYIEMGEYTPNDSTPLLWAQANLMLALNQMNVSLEKY
jgi:Glycosyl hydrolases family 15